MRSAMSKIRFVSDGPQQPIRAYDESGKEIEGVETVLIEKNEGEDARAVVSIRNPAFDVVAVDVSADLPPDISPVVGAMFNPKKTQH